jgi:hypothetical protein
MKVANSVIFYKYRLCAIENANKDAMYVEGMIKVKQGLNLGTDPVITQLQKNSVIDESLSTVTLTFVADTQSQGRFRLKINSLSGVEVHYVLVREMFCHGY